MTNSTPSLNHDPIPYNSFADESYNRIRNQILNGVLDWGDRIDVVSLAEAFGVSRSPIVKAVDRLAREGLVSVFPNKGSYVSVPTENDVSEVIEVRLAIELMTFELACTKDRTGLLEALDENEKVIHTYEVGQTSIPFDVFRTYDRRFHRLFAQFADNKRLLNLFEINRDQIELARTKTYIPATVAQALKMHRTIIESLRQDRADQARSSLRIHIEQVRDDMVATIRAAGARRRPHEQ